MKIIPVPPLKTKHPMITADIILHSRKRIIAYSHPDKIYNLSLHDTNYSYIQHLKKVYNYIFPSYSQLEVVGRLLNNILNLKILPKQLRDSNFIFQDNDRLIIFDSWEKDKIGKYLKHSKPLKGQMVVYSSGFVHYEEFISKMEVNDLENFRIEIEKLIIFDYLICNSKRTCNNILFRASKGVLAVISVSHKLSNYQDVSFYTGEMNSLLSSPFSNTTVKRYQKMFGNKILWSEIERNIKAIPSISKIIAAQYTKLLKSRMYNIEKIMGSGKPIMELFNLPLSRIDNVDVLGRNFERIVEKKRN